MYWRLIFSSANTTHNPYPRRLILKPRICKSSTASNSQDYWEFIKIEHILINSLEYKEFEHSYHCYTLTDSEEWLLVCLCMSTRKATPKVSVANKKPVYSVGIKHPWVYLTILFLCLWRTRLDTSSFAVLLADKLPDDCSVVGTATILQYR